MNTLVKFSISLTKSYVVLFPHYFPLFFFGVPKSKLRVENLWSPGIISFSILALYAILVCVSLSLI